ncbi:unnamed protein product [Closterium sp. NIES-53]
MWCAMGQCYEAQQLQQPSGATITRSPPLLPACLCFQQPEAAIRCYRHPLSVLLPVSFPPAICLISNRKTASLRPHDLRMWCAMGQWYEAQQLQQPEAAIRCYRLPLSLLLPIFFLPVPCLIPNRKAASLRPHDSRMWCAMGQCYEAQQLQQPEAAIRCYRRAVASNESEGLALHKLSKLYEGLGQMRQAAHFYK